MKIFRCLAVLLLGLLALSGTLSAQQTQPDPARLHVVLMVGQSNMAGRAPIGAEDKKPIPGAFLWNPTVGKWVPALPPYNLHSPNRKGVEMQRLNAGPSFARAYLKAHPGAEIGIVCMARGGTSIEEWEPGREKPYPLYDTAVAATKTALEGGGHLAGILWHQGESNNSRVDAYPEQLRMLVASFRADLKVRDLPFVFGQLGSWRPEYELFNRMLLEQPGRIDHTACVETKGLGKIDDAHFSTAAQRSLGERYAAELEKLLRQEK